MSKKSYKRFQLATNQLETAIMLFLTGADKFSVITLAGAADVIFCQLAIRNGKENFTDIIAKEENKNRSRQAVGREVNDTLFINAVKHMDPGDGEYVSLNVEECALGAILKAVVNYNRLGEKKNKLIQAFLYWVEVNMSEKYDLHHNKKEAQSS